MLRDFGKAQLNFSRRRPLILCAFVLLVAACYVIQMGRNTHRPFRVPSFPWREQILIRRTNYTNVSTTRQPTVTRGPPRDVRSDTSERFHRTTLDEIFDKFKSKTSDNCQNVCVENRNICSAKDEIQLSKLIEFSRVPYIPFLSKNQYIFDFEKEYMSYPPVTDNKELPDLALSRIIIKEDKNGRVNCNIHDVITARVELINGYGQQRMSGGDDVRAWMKSLQYRHVAHVEDLRNGSYKISIQCLAPGQFQLFVAVIYPREFLRTVIHQKQLGISLFMAGRFRRGSISEATYCWSAPNIPGRPCLCNLTTINQQSFYCGRPLDPRLTCDDWDAVYGPPEDSVPRPQNCTPAELELIGLISSHPQQRTIKQAVSILVGKKGKQTDLPLCRDLNFNITWDTERRPSGYWDNTKWVSLQCRRPELTPKWGAACLKNTHVWIFGDSNGLRLHKIFVNNSLCTVKFEAVWAARGICINEDQNLTITYTPSEYPLNTGAHWVKRLPHGGVAKQIDSMPSYGKLIVIVHYYLHLVSSHLSVLYARLTAVRDAMARLLHRNPNAIAALRGPHVTHVGTPENHAMRSDSLGIFFIEIIKKIFKGLENKVMFMDGWEMTIALENKGYHPSSTVPHEMVRTLLSFKCK